MQTHCLPCLACTHARRHTVSLSRTHARTHADTLSPCLARTHARMQTHCLPVSHARTRTDIRAPYKSATVGFISHMHASYGENNIQKWKDLRNIWRAKLRKDSKLAGG